MTYCSWLFGPFLLNSLIPEFAATLHSRTEQKYSLDGPLLFITLCQHIYRKHLTFLESIKHIICIITLAGHANNITDCLKFLQDNMRIITATGDEDMAHNDLLPHILMQLRNTTILLLMHQVHSKVLQASMHVVFSYVHTSTEHYECIFQVQKVGFMFLW